MSTLASHKKVERAVKHINELNPIFNAVMETDFYSVTIEPDKYGANVLVIAPLFDPEIVSIDCAIVIGDAMHNLRSAIDLLWYQTVLKSGGAPSRWTRFPFFETREQLEASLFDGSLKQKQITAPIADFVLNNVRSFQGGNPSLWALHQMNVGDKHELPIQIFQLVFAHNIRLQKDDDVILTHDALITEIPYKRRLHGIFWDCTKVYDKGKATIGVGFGFGTLLQGEPVVQSLHRVAEEVTRTIESFEVAGFV